jgi:hypothetical protein
VDVNSNIHPEEAREIIAAVRQIRADSSILAQARDNLGGALDRLRLGGNARAVVAPLLAVALTVATHPAKPMGMWQG